MILFIIIMFSIYLILNIIFNVRCVYYEILKSIDLHSSNKHFILFCKGKLSIFYDDILSEHQSYLIKNSINLKNFWKFMFKTEKSILNDFLDFKRYIIDEYDLSYNLVSFTDLVEIISKQNIRKNNKLLNFQCYLSYKLCRISLNIIETKRNNYIYYVTDINNKVKSVIDTHNYNITMDLIWKTITLMDYHAFKIRVIENKTKCLPDE